MQRKFRLVEPRRETSIENWVTVSNEPSVSNDPFQWIASPRVSVSSPRTLENSFVNEPILTPNSIKVANKPVFFRDDFSDGPIRIKRKRKRSPAPQQSQENFNFKVKFNSTGLVRDTKDWRLDSTRDSNRSSKLNFTVQSQKSLLSCSSEGCPDSSRVFFKTEIKDNVEANKMVTVVNNDGNKTEDRMPPCFSSRENENLIPEEMSETILQPRLEPDASNKVGESRKEIEKLKNEIEELISTNLKDKPVTLQQESNENVENIPTSPKVKTVVKQNTVVHSPPKAVKSPLSVRKKLSNTSVDTTVKEEPKLKSKTYDPESTREFIRKQKQRRKEKLQLELNKKKEEEELKKQKLRDLEEKTTKLIAENVKKSLNKKTKSEEKLSPKSPNAQIVNKNSVNVPQNNRLRARSFDRLADKKKSEENLNAAKGTSTARSRSVSKGREAKICDKKSPVKYILQVQKVAYFPRGVKVSAQDEVKCWITQGGKYVTFCTCCTPTKAIQKSQIKSSVTLNPEQDLINVMQQIDKELKRDELNNNKDEVLQKSQTSLHGDNKIPEPILEKSIIKESSDINLDKIVQQPKQETIVSIKVPEQKIDPVVEEVPLNVRLEIIKNNLEDVVQFSKRPEVVNINGIHKEEKSTKIETIKEIEAIKQKLETNIAESNLEERKDETPAWLLPPSTLPYPYNFISAVRKKLEIATKSYNVSPAKVDTSIQTLLEKEKSNVSVQCSLEKKEISIPEIVPPKPEELKTFSSHKCRKQLVYDSPPKLKSPTSFKDISKDLSQKSEKKYESSKLKSPININDISKELSLKHKNLSGKSKSIFAPESDSDTTFQDIPEISEEEQFSKSKSNNLPPLKNITFGRRAEINEGKKIEIDKPDRHKHITFNRQSDTDINNLIKPDYKIDTSKISRKSSENSSRSKYPSDIENILSQYSKMKASSKSHNESLNSQYSDDFNSSPRNIPSPRNKSFEQNPEKSSLIQTETKSSTRINSSDISKIKSEILASLARKHSSSTSIPLEESVKNSESLQLSNGTRLSRRSIEKILESISKKSPRSSEQNEKSKTSEIKTKNSNGHELNVSISEQSEQEPSIKSKLSTRRSHSSEIKTRNSNGFDLNTSTTDVQSEIETKTKSRVSRRSHELNTSTSDVQIVQEQEPSTKSKVSNKSKRSHSHSKKEESTIASSIPESSAIKTESILDSSIKSSLNKSFNEDTRSETHSTIHSKNESSRSKLNSSSLPNLTKPAVNLKIGREKFYQEVQNNPNQIHLKFQAEVHLLNSFNNSLQQVVAVEKSLLDIDQPAAATVNFRRGCGLPEQIESLSVLEPSICSQDLNMTQMSDSMASETALSITGAQNEQSILNEASISEKIPNPYFGVSLGMFDQMIRDENNRLEYLKAFLKLRDKALFDRTRGELALLEIQKKQLRENGQLNDVTVIKKKQRGLLIKLEQERHEMQRLKQAHKQASKERKNALRKQKSIIKQQLSSTDQIPSKIRRLSQVDRRQSGPIKVYRVESKAEQVRETTMSRNSSGDETTVSVTTSSVVTQISEKVIDHSTPLETSFALKQKISREKAKTIDKHTEKVRRALLMKEADLEKRRKEAEEVIKWNERLKQEEAAVLELERQAKSIQLDDPDKKRVLTGAQLNKIWKGITGTTIFDDHKKYQMSKRSLDKFYQNARKIFKEISDERNSSKRASEDSYTSDFDSTAVHSLTQSNDSDTNISPNKMLSERLRRISVITSSKKDTSTSLSNKKSIVSEILPTDKEIESIHTSKESSDEISAAVSGIESIISKKIQSRKSSTDSDVPELLTDVKESIKNSSKSQIVSEIKQDLINSSEIVEEKSTISSDSDLPELEIVSEPIKSTDITDSVQERILDLIKSDLETLTEHTKPDLKSVEESLSIVDNKTEEQSISEKTEKSSIISIEELKSSVPQETEINSVASQKTEKSSPVSIEELKYDQKSSISQESEINSAITQKSEKSTPVSIEELKYKKSSISQESEINSAVSQKSEKSSPISIEELKYDQKSSISQESEINSAVSQKTEKSTISVEELKLDESEMKSEIKSDKNEYSTDKQISDILSQEKETNSEKVTPVKTEETSTPVKSDDNTSNIVNEIILSQTDIVPSETELKSVVNISSEIENQENLSSKTQTEMPEKISTKSKKSDIQSEAELKSVINTSSEVEEISKIEENQESKISAHDKSTESKSSSTEDYPVYYRSEFEKYNEEESVSEHSDQQTSPESDQVSTKPSYKSEFETDFIKSLSFVHKTEKRSDETETGKSLQEELEIAKSTEKSITSELKSQNSVESEKEAMYQIEDEIILSAEKLSSESPEESKLEEHSKEENLVQSELDKKSEKEIDIVNKSDIISETKESSEKSYFENDQSSEKESDMKSSVEIQTDKITEPITESKDSETFISEKESTTIIESPKSTKEPAMKSAENSEVVVSESQNSKKSSIEESFEEKDNSLQDNAEENSVVILSPESQDSKRSSFEDSFEDKENSFDKNVSGVSHIDVRKRVSEILADSNIPRGDKSPRVQDLYVTTYDVATNSPDGTPETGSPTNEFNKKDKSTFSLKTPYRNEAEELLRKQLEIEQEIIQLERQQQQNIPYLFMREIPNKPPPPYKPPTLTVARVINSVIPASPDQIKNFIRQSADVLFQAFVSGNLKDASYGNEDKVNSQKFVFDLCKEIALDICKPTEEVQVPSWKCQKKKFHSLITRKPLSKEGLYSVMNKKVLQLLNFEPVIRKDNLIIRWSRKKRDHVDEILVLESQSEETEWTNYDSDEQTIKDNLTSDIMNMLISETAQVMCEILNRKKTMLWSNYC